MMDRIRLVVPIFAIAAMTIGALLFFKDEPTNESSLVVPVKVRTISDEAPTVRLVVAATTKSTESVILRAQVAGRVQQINNTLGDSVKAGDVLASIYNPELEPLKLGAKENYANQQAQAEQAQRDYERIDQLFETQAVSRQEWEQANTRLIAAQKARSAAKAEFTRTSQLSKELSLTAPFDARITEEFIEVGELISNGAPIFRLSNPNAVEVRIPLGDQVMQHIKIGKEVDINRSLEPNSATIKGVITQISPFREQGGLPEVVINLNSEQVAPGTPVSATIEVPIGKGVSVPLNSVIMTGNNTVGVYRLENDKAELVPIRPVRINSSFVIVEQGVQPGDQVITQGLSKLFDGVNVRVIQ